MWGSRTIIEPDTSGFWDNIHEPTSVTASSPIGLITGTISPIFINFERSVGALPLLS